MICHSTIKMFLICMHIIDSMYIVQIAPQITRIREAVAETEIMLMLLAVVLRDFLNSIPCS